MRESFNFWPHLTGLLGSLAGLAALLGYLLNRRQMPAAVRLITVQTEVAEATRERTELEGQSIAFNLVSKALADAERTIDRVKGEREAERAQVKLLELQLDRLKSWHKANGWPEPPEQGGTRGEF